MFTPEFRQFLLDLITVLTTMATILTPLGLAWIGYMSINHKKDIREVRIDVNSGATALAAKNALDLANAKYEALLKGIKIEKEQVIEKAPEDKAAELQIKAAETQIEAAETQIKAAETKGK